jgi:hypothetical protein
VNCCALGCPEAPIVHLVSGDTDPKNADYWGASFCSYEHLFASEAVIHRNRPEALKATSSTPEGPVTRSASDTSGTDGPSGEDDDWCAADGLARCPRGTAECDWPICGGLPNA